MVKMNPVASNASSLWMMVATLTNEPGRNHEGKRGGNPRQRAGRADHRDAPEYREVVELLPVGPAAVLRTRPDSEEPLDGPHEVGEVFPTEHHRLRPEQQGLPRGLFATLPADHVDDVCDEDADHRHRRGPVDVASRLESPQQVGGHRRPPG